MIEEVRLSYAPFRNFVSGHVCLVFKFADKREVVISPEASTKKFSVVLGFLFFYRMQYKVHDYGIYQAKLHKKRRSFHELKLPLSNEQMSKLYEHMHERAGLLSKRSEVYHVFFNSCVTNTFMHLKQVTNIDIGFINKVIALNPYQTAIKYYRAKPKTGLPIVTDSQELFQ